MKSFNTIVYFKQGGFHMKDYLVELMGMSVVFKNDNIKNTTKIDTLIEMILEKEQINKNEFKKRYEENLIKEHFNFIQRVSSDGTFHNAEESKDKLSNQHILKTIKELSEKEKEEILKKYR